MIRPADYFLTARDAVALIRKITIGIPVKTIFGELLLCAATALMFFVWGWSIESTMFWLFFISLIYWNVEGRIGTACGIACLVVIMIAQLIARFQPAIPAYVIADRVAIWAYYFLLIGVAKQIIEFAWDSWVGDPIEHGDRIDGLDK